MKQECNFRQLSYNIREGTDHQYSFFSKDDFVFRLKRRTSMTRVRGKKQIKKKGRRRWMKKEGESNVFEVRREGMQQQQHREKQQDNRV